MTHDLCERPNEGVSILEGIRNKVAGKIEVTYSLGCHITKELAVTETELEAKDENPELYRLEEEEADIQEAVLAASQADVAIVCLGGSPNTSREAVKLGDYYGDNDNA
mgnify:CR=1 FL=1